MAVWKQQRKERELLAEKPKVNRGYLPYIKKKPAIET